MCSVVRLLLYVCTSEGFQSFIIFCCNPFTILQIQNPIQFGCGVSRYVLLLLELLIEWRSLLDAGACVWCLRSVGCWMCVSYWLSALCARSAVLFSFVVQSFGRPLEQCAEIFGVICLANFVSWMGTLRGVVCFS